MPPPGSQGDQEPLLPRCGLSRRDLPSGEGKAHLWDQNLAEANGH